MFNKFLSTAALLCTLSGMVAAQDAAAPSPFKTPMEATGYAVGVDMVRNFKIQDVPFDLEQLIHGLRDASAGGKLLMSDTEVTRHVRELEAEVRKKMAAARKVEGEANLKKSEEFMKTNSRATGVITLPSGLQYLPAKMGSGPKASDNSTVIANYRGMLLDGTSFDSSEPGKPVSLKLPALVPGWREAVKLMPAGSKWQLFIPPNLAYGERGAGRTIGPNQALKYDVEIIEVR